MASTGNHSTNRTPANTGANTHNHSIGCGPVAWATLLAWHDQNWTPDLLRGSQSWNKYDWGDESGWSTWTDRMLMGLHHTLGTHGPAWYETLGGVSGDAGVTYDSGMINGFVYLDDHFGNLINAVAVGNSLQYLCDALTQWDRPLIIKLPSHYAVAAGFLFDMSGAEAHFITVNTGWGDIEYFLSDLYEEKLWGMYRLLPTKKTTYPISSASRPSIVPGFPGKDGPAIYFQENDGQIMFIQSDSADKTPDLSSKTYTGLSSQFGFCAIQKDDGIVVLTLDSQRRIKLYWRTTRGTDWIQLPFPALKSNYRPVLCWSQDYLVVVLQNDEWGIQIMGSKAPYTTWALPLATPNSTCYWVAAGFTETDDQLAATIANGRVLAVWRDPARGGLVGYVGDVALGATGASTVYYVQDIPASAGFFAPHLFNSRLFNHGAPYLGLRTSNGQIFIRRVVVRLSGGIMGMGPPPVLSLEIPSEDTRAELLETCIRGPVLESAYVDTEGAAETRWTWLAWLGTDAQHKLNLWRFTMDDEAYPMSYTGWNP